ncbi:DNA polymerase III subunit alpha [Micromonospora sonneratiae]|uniref:DNA polymerase III subunit alpha n=1 Tax=Micromonospora sonneratiae TaxID=1184706 RepID=A0ABW3YAZ7_9ACTN
MPDQVVHLHTHTEYSMLDGAAQHKPLFAEAARLGQTALAMTDHGNMFGAYSFYNAAKDSGVKPILGIEAYLAPGDRTFKKPVFWGTPEQRRDDLAGGGAYTHMTMWAANSTGLRNLFKLSTDASLTGYYRKPRMDRDLIAEHSEGVIATTGCPSGEVQTRLRLGQFDEALKAASAYQDIFGKENFFLEVMDHGLDIERRIREDLLEIGRKLNIPPVATNDSHYVTRDEARRHEVLLCVQSGSTMNDPNRFKFDGDTYYLQAAEEMRTTWDNVLPGACDNTLLIAERVESYAEVFDLVDRMPVFDVPEGHTQESWLRHETATGLRRRFPDGVPDGYQERLDYELGVITEKGFPAYFLVVGDLVSHAREIGIRVGPGRGSAAGSLVAYVLGITNIDPIANGLLFERFLNPERASMPDIDIDFDDRRRGEMVRYATEKYGADRVAQVITYGTIKAKAAIKDATRVLGFPYALGDRITKAMPPAVLGSDIPLKGIVDPNHPRYKEATEIRKLIEEESEISTVFETARGLEGLIRQAGVHACAVILSSSPLVESVPLWAREDGSIITGWDYPSCEAVGLLKMDFLGLRNLTVMGDAIDNVRANRGLDIDLDRLTTDDPTTYELLARGGTLGVFQLDGGPMRELLRRMRPTTFEDIIAVGALYRPGPMGVNAHNDYADRKNGRQEIKSIHPELEEPLQDILAETYGLIVYQEQIMFIAQKVAGYTMGRADVLRKAMGKKKPEVLAKEFEGFRAGMLSMGFSDEAVRALWDTILPFAGYAFNKSHAAAYALVSYWTAYLKANYPAEYMAALLTSVGDNKDKMAVYLAECRAMGIKVLSPDVNESNLRFSAVGEDIRFGLGGVRNVGANVVESIVATRKAKGRYETFPDFLSKSELTVCNKRVVESLIKAGAFDSLKHTRRGLFEGHADAIDAVVPIKRKETEGQFDLFGDGFNNDQAEGITGLDFAISDQEWPRRELLALEREMLGLYVSSHPLAGAERVLARNSEHSTAVVADSEQLSDGATVALAGLLTGTQRRMTKAGKVWAVATLEDLSGSVEVLFFPNTYELLADAIVEDAVVAIKGRVNQREDSRNVAVTDMAVLEISEHELAANPPVVLTIQTEKVTPALAEELHNIVERHEGQSPLQVRLRSRGGKVIRLALGGHSVSPDINFRSEIKGLLGAGALE